MCDCRWYQNRFDWGNLWISSEWSQSVLYPSTNYSLCSCFIHSSWIFSLHLDAGVFVCVYRSLKCLPCLPARERSVQHCVMGFFPISDGVTSFGRQGSFKLYRAIFRCRERRTELPGSGISLGFDIGGLGHLKRKHFIPHVIRLNLQEICKN